MTFSRGSSIALVTVILGAMAWIYFNHEADRRILRDTNMLIDEAAAFSATAKDKTAALEALSTDGTIKNNRGVLEAAAWGAIAPLDRAAAKWTLAAELTSKMIDRAQNDSAVRVWTLRRDALLKMAEASEATATAYRMWFEPRVVDRQSGLAAMEPHIQRAEAARAEADRLKAEAKALEKSVRPSP